jgi:hypothetical protein
MTTHYYCCSCRQKTGFAPSICHCNSVEFTTCYDCALIASENRKHLPAPAGEIERTRRFATGLAYDCMGYCAGKPDPSVNGGHAFLIGNDLVLPGVGVIDRLPSANPGPPSPPRPPELPVKSVTVANDEYAIFARNGAPDCSGDANAALDALGAWWAEWAAQNPQSA